MVTIKKKLDLKEELDKEIQSQLIFLFLPYRFFLFLSSLTKNIDGINIFNHEYLHTTYADYTTFFLKNQTSVKNVSNDIETFLNFSGLRTNKCELAGIGILKNVKCGTMWYEKYRPG